MRYVYCMNEHSNSGFDQGAEVLVAVKDCENFFTATMGYQAVTGLPRP